MFFVYHRIPLSKKIYYACILTPSFSLQQHFVIRTPQFWYTPYMFIQVQLLNGFSERLWYQRPDDWHQKTLIGAIVQVPLRNRRVSAVVMREQDQAPSVSFAIKPAIACEQMPKDEQYQLFIKQLSYYYQTKPLHFIKRIKQFLIQKEMKDISPPDHTTKKSTVSLTQEQKTVLDALTPHVLHPTYQPTVLHGVTGSGKTEIYKELSTTALSNGKTVILLLPEVSVALELEKRLRNELDTSLPFFSFHSATPTKQKRLLWQHLVAHKPVMIIGVHLPILLPIANLGLIIIDEEHDVGYQEKKHPKINSKEAALIRAKLANIPIILGSATPSLHSLFNVKTKQWNFFQLKKRFAGSFPTVKTVLLTDKKARREFWISNELHKAIAKRLSKKEQTIIFLNRRGHSFFVQCKACSFIIICPSCSVSLTLHSNETLVCHYCGHGMQQPKQCSACSKSTFIKKGIGTQQVVSILQSLFPTARIARADLDSSRKKKLWQQIVQDVHNRTIDILVGTQTITKGYHFPHVTLVGILWADLNLNFPIFNASETTLQQLIQVAGRAGRQLHESEVIVQSMSEHTIFDYIHEVDYLRFYNHELQTRQELGYPPSQRLVEIEIKHTNEAIVERESHALAALLATEQQRLALSAIVLGPAKPPVHKIKNLFSRKIYIKAKQINDIITLYQKVDHTEYTSNIFFTPNPSQ